MSQLITYLQKARTYWGMLGAKTSVRFEDAITAAEQKQYTFQNMVADVLGFYEDSIDTLMYVTGPNQGGVKPITITVQVKKGTNALSQTCNIPVSGGTALTCSDLTYQSTGKPTPPPLAASAHINVTVPKDDNMKIDFRDLKTAVKVGSYEGQILQANNVPLVAVVLEVS